MNIKPWLLAALLSYASLTHAAGSDLSHASGALSAGSVVVVGGTVSVLAGSGYLIVKSVEVLADGVQVVLEGVSEAGQVSIKLSGEAALGLSLAVGSTVEAVALSTGTVLVAAGTVLAFIPNEIGRALLYRERSIAYNRR